MFLYSKTNTNIIYYRLALFRKINKTKTKTKNKKNNTSKWKYFYKDLNKKI